MPIEIIGEAERVKKEIICSNCASILRYTFSDTKIETRYDYTGGSDTYRVLTCPKCAEEITVPRY